MKEEDQVSFLGGLPPVTVKATNGAVVDVHYTVKFLVGESGKGLEERFWKEIAKNSLENRGNPIVNGPWEEARGWGIAATFFLLSIAASMTYTGYNYCQNFHSIPYVISASKNN